MRGRFPLRHTLKTYVVACDPHTPLQRAPAILYLIELKATKKLNNRWRKRGWR